MPHIHFSMNEFEENNRKEIVKYSPKKFMEAWGAIIIYFVALLSL